MTTIVVSAVNLRKGGTLTILRQCLEYLSSLASIHPYRIVALVHKRELADYPYIEYIELPWAIDSWGKRLWCEYVTMHKISKQIGNIDLWLSLHDTSPRVIAKRQAVYCQTSFPFLKWRLRDFHFDPKIPLFALFTRFAYLTNIHANSYLIVQQEWLRRGFSKMFRIPTSKFIVAPPKRDTSIPAFDPIEHKGLFTFFFASTPDSHKGFETLCEASRLLESQVGKNKFQTIITVRGDENKYAQYLKSNWGDVTSISFAGLMDKSTLYAHYHLADCFVFPSRVETWGLPITEYMQVHGGTRPMILPDLPYAHETSATASLVCFFPSEHAQILAERMQETMMSNHSKYYYPKELPLSSPTAKDWHELFDILLN